MKNPARCESADRAPIYKGNSFQTDPSSPLLRETATVNDRDRKAKVNRLTLRSPMFGVTVQRQEPSL
jgi:hypothetical protein